MKILVIAPHPYYIDRGTPIDVDLLLRALSARGDSVDLVCYDEGEDRQYPGVSIHRGRGYSWLNGSRPGFSLRKIVADLFLFGVVHRLVRGADYDVVHAGEEGAFLAMWLRWRRGLPYVYDMDSSVAQQLVEQLPWLRPMAAAFNWLERAALRRCIAAAPVCNALGDLAREAGAPHVRVLHDISQLEGAGRPPTGLLQSEWGVDRPCFLYVGNLQSYQGIDLLLESYSVAIREGTGFDLVVAGGQERKIRHYQEKARELGISDRVHWLGPWPAERLGELLAEAEALVAPRIRGLNTPMKVFPYLHSGRPLLATDLPTHTQILDSDVALLAAPTPEAFGSAMLRLERDADLRQSLGRHGREFVEADHTFEAHVKRVDELYAYVERQVELADGQVRPQKMSRSITARLKKLPIDLGQGDLRFTTKGKKIAFDLVPDGDGAWALDLGCREGVQSQWLRSRGYRVASVDVAPLCKRAIAADANATLPFRSGQFDLVWCSEVIEHLRDPVQFRTEVERILAPGGRLILTTPNSAFWLYWIAHLFGKSPRELQNPDHKHFFAKQDIRTLFPGARVYGYFPYFLIKTRIRRGVGPLSPTFVVEYAP